MGEQLTPKQKKIVACLGAVGILAAAYVWQADDENALSLAETASSQQTAAVEKEAGASSSASDDKAKYQKICGLESQTPLEELRNPFSPAHEKRGEPAAAEKNIKPDGKKTQADVRGKAPLPHGQTSSPAAVGRAAGNHGSPPAQAEHETGPQLQLRGIVQGGGEPLVILSDGRQSTSLAVGESFAGHEVVAIGEQGVELSSPDGEKWLPLASLD